MSFRVSVRSAVRSRFFDQLLGDRAAALGHATGARVDPKGADQAANVETGVLEEAIVFHRDHGVDERARQLGEADRTMLVAGFVAGAGEHFALELGVLGREAVDTNNQSAMRSPLAQAESQAVRGFSRDWPACSGAGGTSQASRVRRNVPGHGRIASSTSV